ncbi:MAG: D-arabinono-1,4-lactone oxidase, partial [Aeromonas veronii]
LCDAVAAMTVMLASGEIIRVDSSDPRFGAFVMGMGMLGILLDVTLRTVPNRIMRCTKFTTDYPFLLEHNERLNREHGFVKSWWFAWTGESHIWLVDPASDEEVARYRAGGSEPLLLDGDIDARMNATIDATLQKMAKDTKDEALAGEHFETVRRFKDASDLVGNVYQILCKGIPAPQINCEVAVPLHRMNEALETLQAWQQANPGVLHYPFILRCTGPSEAWLSAAYGQSVCWIGFLVYLAADGTFVNGSMEQMRELQQLLAPLGGIPHFGKHLAMDLYDFPALLPRWNDFVALKAELDPHGRFENRWLSDLFANR